MQRYQKDAEEPEYNDTEDDQDLEIVNSLTPVIAKPNKLNLLKSKKVG